MTYTESEVFERFLSELKEEARKNGENFELTDEEARELFEMMQDEFLDALDSDNEDVSLSEEEEDDDEDEALFEEHKIVNESEVNIKDHAAKSQDGEIEEIEDSMESVEGGVSVAASIDQSLSTIEEDPVRLAKIQDIQDALPGLPINRVKKIVKAFEDTLGYPSVLSLVPLLRENMPDHMTSKWLKRKNNANAEVAWRKACEDRVVDSALLNTMLQVKTSYGHIQQALDFHQEEFAKHGQTPSTYSDRLVFQMLVSNDRLSRALKFKENIEGSGRSLDLASYGTLIQYYSRRNQLGSALMTLKECLQTHGAPPSESFLAQLRVLFKKQSIGQTDKAALNEMIGEDPVEWLKHGERYLKREKSKKGRRDIQYAQNRLLA